MLTQEQKYKIIYRKFDENKEGVPACPICGNGYRHSFQRQSLKCHFEDVHPELLEDYENLLLIYHDRQNATEIVCPICGKVYATSLAVHLQLEHDYIDLDDFRKAYPEYPISLKKKKIKSPCACTICGKSFNYTNALTNHMRITHGIVKAAPQESDCNTKHFLCGICDKKFNNLKDHVCKNHHISWDEYCEVYNHNISERSFHTESHNLNVSKSKLAYYSSDDSIENKKALSRRATGENNPSKRPEVKAKISKAHAKHLQEYNLTFCGPRGLRICCPDIGLFKYTRSFQEFKVAYTLFVNNISYEYEPEYIQLNDRAYVPDFKINRPDLANINFEIKIDYRQVDTTKYEKISTQLSKIGQTLMIFTYEDICNFLQVKQIAEEDILHFCSEMLELNKLQIMCMIIKGRHSRLLAKICPNYTNNTNIQYIECGNKRK